MNFTDYISEQKEIISEHLVSFLREKHDFFGEELHTIESLKKLQTFSLQGKMLRGMLVLVSYQLISNKETVSSDALSAAVALELTQSGALIHDDIMDQDVLRRGVVTIHEQYKNIGTKNAIAEPKLFGDSMGICLGDIGFFFAFELLGKLNNPQVLQTYTKLMQRCISGQISDVHLGNFQDVGEKDEILQMYLNKTGYYSVVLPLLIGAQLAQSSKEQQEVLKEIGKGLGIIFQIRDDVLGLLGDEKDTGKPQGSDIRENKKTLVRLLLYTSCTGDERKKLDELFGNEKFDTHALTYVLDLYDKYQIDKEVNNVVQQYSKPLEPLFSRLPQNTFQEILFSFYKYSLTRKT